MSADSCIERLIHLVHSFTNVDDPKVYGAFWQLPGSLEPSIWHRYYIQIYWWRKLAWQGLLLSGFARLFGGSDLCGRPPHPAASWQHYRGNGGLLQAPKDSPAEGEGSSAASSHIAPQVTVAEAATLSGDFCETTEQHVGSQRDLLPTAVLLLDGIHSIPFLCFERAVFYYWMS